MALTRDANSETDLAGYNVYRSTGTVTKDTPINGGTLLTSPAYTDTTGTPGTAYNYAVTAVDTSTNESHLSGEATGTPSSPEPGAYGLDLGSDTAYVTFGDPDKLGLAVFTLETWFKRTGTGATTSTGTGGITAIPLVTKGRGEADGNNRDMNYFLGIQGSDGVLAADFEDLECGRNHKVTGTTAIPADSTWHHAAATYDGSTWRLYLDGVLDGSATILCAPANVCVPRSDSIQHAGLGTAMTSTGVAAGHFEGILDERVSGASRVPAPRSRLTSMTSLRVGPASWRGGAWARVQAPRSPTPSPCPRTERSWAPSTWVAGAPFDLHLT